MRALHAVVVVAVVLLCVHGAAAQDGPPPSSGAGVELGVSPLQLPAGAEPPGDPRYLYTLSIGMATWLGVEIVADRRLLSFEVTETGARRPLRCSDPTAPRFSPTSPRVRRLGPAGAPGTEGNETTYSEWIDLRAYCSGRALAALDRGAHVVPHYGFAHGPRNAWVARSTELTGADARSVKELVGPAFDVAPRTPATASTGDALVSMSGADRDTQASVSFRVTLRATSARRVYVLPDQWHFRIRSALGTHECGMERLTIVPIADFFRRIDRRRGATLSLEARTVCPGALPLSGIYEVTPLLTLPYAAPTPHEAESLTGSFEGPTVVVRLRRGDRGYVEQNVEDLAPPPARRNS